MSIGSGAYLGSIAIVTLVALPFSSSSLVLTVPTLTPEMRTSASWASVVASGKATAISYCLAFRGTDPPKVSHRYSRIAKQDAANATMVISRPMLGAFLFTVAPACRCSS